MKKRNRLLLLCLVIGIVLTVTLTLLYPSPSGSNQVSDGSLFSFAQMTDSQFSGSNTIFEKTTWWLSQNNFSLIIHTGDIVGSASDETSWRKAYQYMHQLDNKTTWVAIAGDDDVLVRRGVSFTNYERFLGNATDQYVVIENRILFIFLNTLSEGGEVSTERLDWMDQVIENHNDLLVVLCLHHSIFEFPFVYGLSASNAGEIWNRLIQHENVILTLSGHVHLSWVRVKANQDNGVWALSTEALLYRGYVRLFDVYEDRLEVSAYSAWENKSYMGTLDRFTIRLNAADNDEDRDLWSNGADMMPTHPLVPNGIICSAVIETTIIMYWQRKRRADKTTDKARCSLE